MFFPYTRRVTNLNHLTIDLPHFSAILPNFRNAFSSGISIIICTTITSFTQGGERTSQSRDQTLKQNINLGILLHFELVRLIFSILWSFLYVTLHLLSMKTTSCLLFLHDKLFNILHVLYTYHYKGKITWDTFTPFLK